jgi:hypothetical protein
VYAILHTGDPQIEFTGSVLHCTFQVNFVFFFSSSSSVCGAGGIPPNVLQPTEAYCANLAFWFPSSSPEALHVRRRERPLSVKGGTMGREMAGQI